MPPKYSLFEPHRNHNPNTSYAHTGRGGAGNKVRATPNIASESTSTGPASLAPVRPSSISSSSSRTWSQYPATYTLGRGGAGNIHTTSIVPERAIFSFDEELDSQLRHDPHIAPIYHVGRGGAGNSVTNRHLPHSPYKPTAAGTQGIYPESAVTDRKSSSSISHWDFDRASSKSDASTTGSESGADFFTRNLGKGLMKFGQVGRYMTS